VALLELIVSSKRVTLCISIRLKENTVFVGLIYGVGPAKSSTWLLDDLQLIKKRGITRAEHTDNQHPTLQDQEVLNPCSVAAQMNEMVQGQLGDIPEV
jgi:hypothetical protein